MSTVINKKTLQVVAFADTPKYKADEWLINPVLPKCEKKYWKVEGDKLIEMTATEKAVVDKTYADRLTAQAEAFKDPSNLQPLVKQSIFALFDEINKLRKEMSLKEVSLEEFKTAVKSKLG